MPNRKKIINPADGGLWGIMGGTFNPIHYGHLMMAEMVKNSLHADGMIFIPARTHPCKPDDKLISTYFDRLIMTRLAIESNDRFILEESPEDSHFTYDLVEYLRDRFPKTQLCLVIGSDLIAEFPSWHRHKELEDLVRIAIAARPGYDFEQTKERGLLQGAERIMIPQFDIASHEIRRRVRAGLSIKYLLPESVEKYIREKNLYA